MDTEQLQEHTAAHLSNLALARWRHNHRTLAPTAAQALWLREKQAGYLAWLRAGGFTQAPEAELTDRPESASAIENSGIAPLFSAPLRDY